MTPQDKKKVAEGMVCFFVDDKYVEILHWLSRGLSADEIAGKVYLSPIAVKARLQRLA
jgi:DNA-binding NarL/FixJ family response regulator